MFNFPCVEERKSGALLDLLAVLNRDRLSGAQHVRKLVESGMSISSRSSLLPHPVRLVSTEGLNWAETPPDSRCEKPTKVCYHDGRE